MLIRTLLIWLLALAIPAQGAAASTMAFCGAGHHGGTAAATADDAAAGHVHGGHLSVAALEDPQADLHGLADDGVGEPTEVKVGSADDHKCNVCGSCCATGALVSTDPALPVAASASTEFPSAQATVEPYAANGPDRPPRILLA